MANTIGTGKKRSKKARGPNIGSKIGSKALRSSLGSVLAAQRARRGLTQVEVAEVLGITQPAVSLIESGMASVPLEGLAKLADAYRIAPISLVSKLLV